MVDFRALIVWRGGVAFLQGVLRKSVIFYVVFCGEFVVDAW